jgi:hypothetical protein
VESKGTKQYSDKEGERGIERGERGIEREREE